MTGLVLAGGTGSRLAPATEIYNKHLALVYDAPMALQPLNTLKEMGCDEVIIISSPQGASDLVKLVKDGSDFGLDVKYKIQREAGGVAQALGCVANERLTGVFPVLLADTYFDPSPKMPTKPTIWFTEVPFARQHGIYNPETHSITEKPIEDIGKRAITGAYVYDERVFDVVEQLQPSNRGELEITDVNNWYLEHGADIREYNGYWGDMGTPSGLLRVAKHLYLRDK